MNGVYQTRFDYAEQSPVHAVVTTVAVMEDAEPVDLPPLKSVIDPDALNALFATSDGRPVDGRLSFTYCGYGITVRSNGTVSVDGDSIPIAEEATD